MIIEKMQKISLMVKVKFKKVIERIRKKFPLSNQCFCYFCSTLIKNGEKNKREKN